MNTARLDISEAYKWWDTLRDGNQLTEIRLISNDGRTASGIFDNIDNIISAILPYTQDWNVYYTINRLKDDVRGLPQYNRIIQRPKQTCNDNTIAVRDYVCVDLDSVRLSGTNATDEQIAYTKKKANEVYQFLRDMGMNAPCVVFSSNGVHLYIKCAMLNTEGNTKLVKRFLQALSMLFSDEHTDIDVSVHNAGRIMRLPSSYSCKGNTMDTSRPQRLCKFVKIPADYKVNDIAYFQKIADLYPEEDVRPSRENNYSTERFDLDAFLDKHKIAVKKIESVAGGKKYVLEHCVFNDQHRNKDAVIFQRDSGALAYVCLHASCSHYTWRDVRLKFDPTAYQYRDSYPQRKFEPSKPRFEVVKESQDKGKKWLSMPDIKRVDIEDLLSIPTGYHELDKKIVGLFAGELTIISGLNASGKTSWLDCIALNVIQQGFKAGIWSGEMQDWRFQGWMHQIAAGKAYTRKKAGYENLYYVQKPICDKIDTWLDGKLYLYNNSYGSDWQQLFHDIQELVEKEGVQLIILDNLAALNIEGYDGEKYSKQTKFVLDVKEYAKKKNIHVILVCHPRKQLDMIRRESVSGTADLTNICDNLILIHRVNKDFETRAGDFFGKEKVAEYLHFSTVLEVAKNRQFGVVDHLVGMYYEPESRRLKNSVAEHIVYGWQEEVVQAEIPADTLSESVAADFLPNPTDEEAPF